MRHINQLEARCAGAVQQRSDTVCVGRKLDAFRQRAGKFEESVFMHAMASETGRRTKYCAAGNAEIVRLFKQPFMHQLMRVPHAFLDKKADTDRLHDYPRISLNVHTPSAVMASDPNRCADAAVSAQPS